MIESHTPPPLASPAPALRRCCHRTPSTQDTSPRSPPSLVWAATRQVQKRWWDTALKKKKKIDPQQVQIPSYKPSESEWGSRPEPAPRLGGNFERKSREKLQEASRSILRAQNADRPDRSCCARGGHGGPRLGRKHGSVSFSVSTTSGTSSRSPSRVRNCLFFLHLGEAQLP